MLILLLINVVLNSNNFSFLFKANFNDFNFLLDIASIVNCKLFLHENIKEKLFYEKLNIFTAGTFNDQEGESDLSACENNKCPPGKYCPSGSGSTTNAPVVDCPQGFFCVEGQIGRYQNPCFAGTYGDNTGFSGDNFVNFDLIMRNILALI